MELYLCRHSETEWSRLGRHTSCSDISLTEEGKRQSILLGKTLSSIHFDAIYSSPAKRAQETCHLAGLSPIIDPDLVEWNYGAYEGLTHDEILQKNPKWDLFTEGAPQGELPAEVALRADRFLKKIKNGRVILFCHGHFGRVLAVRWLGLGVEMARHLVLGEASLSILGFERSDRVIRLWNEKIPSTFAADKGGSGSLTSSKRRTQ